MSNIKDQIPFADFGLNSDDAHRYMPKGLSPYNLNCLKGEDGWGGELTNLKGNRKVTYPLGNSNTYFVLSSCYDPLTRNVYYWIFSQPYDVTGSGDYEYDNRLVRFNEDSEVIDTIFYDTKNYFGLDPNTPFKDSFVLGDWLFFNPQESEPKMICITMALNYTKALKNLDGYSLYNPLEDYVYGNKIAYLGGIFLANTVVNVGENPVSNYAKWDRIGDCYQNETDLGTNNPYYDSEFRYAFNVIKHISMHRPVCIYASDPDKNANNVRGKLFRFATRYKYFDNSYSRYSSYSDITLPLYDEYYNGEVPGDLDQFNCIDVSVDLHSAALIKEIDIIFQETGGDWKRAKIVNRQDILILNQLNYTYRFYNTDSAYETIDDTYFYESHDAVPKKANSQEIINKNILCYGGCTEGFDNLDKNDIDVSLTPESEALSVPYYALFMGIRHMCFDVSTIFPYYSCYIDIGSWYPGGVIQGDILRVNISGQGAEYRIQAGDTANVHTFINVITAFLALRFPMAGITADLVNDRINFGLVNITEFTFYDGALVETIALTKARGFKTGAWHPFCIYYYDAAMRRWDAQTSKDLPEGANAWEIDGTTVYVPMLGEVSPVLSTANKWNINWEVFHLPPEGAKWWRWGYAGNALCESKNGMVQYIVSVVADHATQPWTGFNITPLQTLKNPTDASWNEYPQSIIEPYAWRKGDRVRVITEKSSTGLFPQMGDVVDGVYDYEILKYDDTTVAGEYWIYVQDFDYSAINVGINSLIEIYTPIKTDTAKIFHEFGNLMPILEDANGEWVHGCGTTGTQNQDTLLNVPATGTFHSGDVYHIIRTPSKPISGVNGYFHESQWYSDFYDSDDWDKGRIGVETNYGERDLNIIRYSDQYLQNTLINGMPTFHGMNYKELTNTYGEVKRIIEIGDTLKVYQRKKPSSILIGRTEYVDAAGKSNIVEISDRIFGSIRYSTTDYGTEFSESISRNNRYVYGYDIYNGVMWRDSANGIFPISGRYESADGGGDFKMETYFKQKAKDLLVSGIGGVSVLTVWDERYKNLYVIFKDSVNESNDEALMFHEPSNRWICFTNMDQTPAGGWNQILELDWYILWGFDGGIGYLFNEDTRFAEFDLETSASAKVFPSRQDITYTLYVPTITASCSIVTDLTEVKITPYKPDIVVSYVHIAATTMNWLATEGGIEDRKSTTVLCSPSPCIIPANAIPTGFSMANASLAPIGIGDTIANGDTIYIYPDVDNIGVALSGNLRIDNSNSGYSDYDTIALSQDATILAPTVFVYMDGNNPTETGFGAIMNGSMVAGEYTVDITFWVNDTRYSSVEIVPIHYRVEINSGSDDCSGWIPNVHDEVYNYPTITLNHAANVGDIVKVYIRGVIPQDETVIITPLSILWREVKITIIPISGVIISQCSASVVSFNFDYDEDSRAEAIAKGDQTVITGLPMAKIVSMPSWVTIWSELYSHALYQDDTIINGETLTLYPTSTNSGYTPIPGSGNDYIVLASTYDSTVKVIIAVNQDANSTLPPGQVPLPAGVATVHSNSTDYLTIIDNAYSIFGLSLSTYISYSFKGIRNALYGYGDYIDIYYRVDITRGGSTFTDGFGVISGIQNSQDTDNYYPFAGDVTLASSTLGGDIVTLYLSIYSF